MWAFNALIMLSWFKLLYATYMYSQLMPAAVCCKRLIFIDNDAATENIPVTLGRNLIIY